MELNSIMEHKILEQIKHIDDTICHDKKKIKELEMQLEKLNEEYNKKYKHYIGKYVRYIGSMTFSGNLITCIKVKDVNFNYDKSLGGNYAEFEGIGYSVGFDAHGKTMISVSECMKFRLFDSDLNSSENREYSFEKIKEIDEETYKSFLNETIEKVVIN